MAKAPAKSLLEQPGRSNDKSFNNVRCLQTAQCIITRPEALRSKSVLASMRGRAHGLLQRIEALLHSEDVSNSWQGVDIPLHTFTHKCAFDKIAECHLMFATCLSADAR